MLGIRVSVPIACFRKGLAREYLETESLPPPATCYGFLLSLVGETKRSSHASCRVTPVLLNEPAQSVVLRTLWRVKSRPLGSPGNTRPDYQQLLSPIELVLWLDSAGELNRDATLEQRVGIALMQPERIVRFGGLSIGESTHLVNDVNLFVGDASQSGRVFLKADRGRMTLPVWVDHVGSAATNYVTGDLVTRPLVAPPLEQMPCIEPRPR
jgi:CRISPR-associated protein Cas5t